MSDDTDRERQLEELLRALFILLMNRAGRHAKPDEILAAARRVAEELLAKCTIPVAWETAAHATVHNVRRPTMLYKPVRVIAHVVQMDEPRLVRVYDVNGAAMDTVATRLRVMDIEGEQIDTLDITGEVLVDRVSSVRKLPQVELLARTLAVPDLLDARFMLQVFDLRPSFSALDLLGARDNEREAAFTLLADLASDATSPLEFMLGELERGMRVVALEEFPLLRQLLRFTILQAVSCGRLDHASGRLHAMVAGPPASGKKLLGLAGRALNPRCEEASAAKISAAGLVGASHNSQSGWQSTPGLIARADQGVVTLQDAHAISPAELRRLGPILQEVIEDGIVRDSVAGGLRRETAAALLIDLNRFSQLASAGGKGSGSEAALLLLRPLLSRIDLVVDIPADVTRAWKVGAVMYRTIGAAAPAFDSQPWVRRLRLLVGALRDRHTQIDLGPVRAAMEAAHNEIAKQNERLFSTLPELGDIPVRLAITMARFVSASARAHDRSVAMAEDLEEALAFVRLKLEFLRVTVPDLADAVASAPRADGYEEAQRRHAGQAVHWSAFAETYAETTGDTISQRTARRHLQQLGGARRGRGIYLLPPATKDE